METPVFSNEQLSDFTRWCKVICEPNRLLLLEQIIEGVQCNCELGGCPADGPQPDLPSPERVARSGSGRRRARSGGCSLGLLFDQPEGVEELRSVFGAFFDPDRIQPRRLSCGPKGDARSRARARSKLEK